MKLSTLLNAIGGFILATIIAVLLCGGIDLMSAVYRMSDFMRIAVTVMLAAAFWQLRSIAKQ